MRLMAYFPELKELQECDSNGWNPNVDLFENQDEWIVLAEVPGLSKSDLKVDFEDGVLTLKGKKKDDSDQDFRLRETRTGNFCRGVAFPSEVDPELINAELKNGILKVRVPKPEVSQPKHIKVN